MHLAAIHGNPPVVEALLEAGADPILLNAWNRSCIHRAMFYGRQQALQMMLDAAGDRYDPKELEESARLEPMPHERIKELRKYD